MKNHQKIFTLLILLITMFFSFQSTVSANSEGADLFQKAEELKSNGSYTQAYDTYELARTALLAEGNEEKALEARNNMFQIQKIFIDYPLTEEEVRETFKKVFKDLPESQLDSWLEEGKIDFITGDGINYYFQNFAANLMFRNKELQSKDFYNSYKNFFNKYRDIIFKDPGSGYTQKAWQPYTNPVSFLVAVSVQIPKEKLPQEGLMKIWFPIPVQTATQRDIKIISVTPEEYIKTPPQIDGDLGILYMEVPLDEQKEDLSIELAYSFTHYQQNFIVDPKKVGKYDKNSELYKKYTLSSGNTIITGDIKKLASEIVGDEKNPYLAAKKIYDYIMANISYSLMPHLTLGVLGEPESVYIHENKRGDCGTQSLYFAALCRSLGIPARTTGGYQLCPDKNSPHFWAEFYLPNYGWLPVDTSIAQIADYIPDITEEERQQFKDFFFGNQDPYRFVIQKDIDVPLTPVPEEPVLIPMAIQFPCGTCNTSEGDVDYLIIEHLKIDIRPIDH